MRDAAQTPLREWPRSFTFAVAGMFTLPYYWAALQLGLGSPTLWAVAGGFTIGTLLSVAVRKAEAKAKMEEEARDHDHDHDSDC